MKYRSMDELIEHVSVHLDLNDGEDAWTQAIGAAIDIQCSQNLDFLQELIRLGDNRTLYFIILESTRTGMAYGLQGMQRLTREDTIKFSGENPKDDCDLFGLYYEVIKFECWRRGQHVDGLKNWPRPEMRALE